MAQTNIFDYKPTPDGTVVKEVDENGRLAGREFFSFGWNTRNRPSDRTDGCQQWINDIVVSETREGAFKGRSLAVPTGTIASSSPSSRDVCVIHVDDNGVMIDEFRVPYVLVPSSTTAAAGIETEYEIWLSNEPFNPATTPIEQLEKNLCGSSMLASA